MSDQSPPGGRPGEGGAPDPFSREGAAWSPPPTEPAAFLPPPPLPPPPPQARPPMPLQHPATPYPPYAAAAGPPGHPRATAALVLGLVGLVLSLFGGVGGLVGIVGVVLGSRAKHDIDGDPARWSGRGRASAGVVTGVLGLVVLALWVLLFVLGSLA